MARPFKPWYHDKKQAYVIEPRGKIHVLVRGPECPDNYRKACEELQLWSADQIRLRRASPPVDGGDPTVFSVIEAFLTYDERRSKPRTFAERKRYLVLFNDVYGDYRVADLKAYHLTKWLDDHTTWRSESTLSYATRSVKRPFWWAVRQGLLSVNPLASVPCRGVRRRRPITDEEFAALYHAAHPRLREVLIFASRTGARPGEIPPLKWADVRFDDDGTGVVTLAEHKTATTRRDGAARVIVLDQEVVALLWTIRSRGDHDTYVFVSRLRRRWARGSIQQGVYLLRKKLGLPADVTFNTIRHAFGTRAVLKGLHLKTISELMGHRTTRQTEHYQHLAGRQRHLADAMRQANDGGPSVSAAGSVLPSSPPPAPGSSSPP